MFGTPSLEWHAQFRKSGIDYISWFVTLERAIEAACALIDEGNDVYGIGLGPLDISIEKTQIARIYAMWEQAKPPAALFAAETKDGR